jgi:MFS family permease
MSGVGEVLRLGLYQRFLAAAICSGVGLWIFQTAIYWAALQSGSTSNVGILVAVIALPSLLLTIPAGLLTDRVGPFWLLFIGQTAPAIACAAGVALVSPDGSISLEPAALVTFVVGAAYALWNVPALVFVTRIVPPRLMGSAIALMVVQYATGRIVGGALGGVLVSTGGARLAFEVTAALFVLGAAAVLTLPRITGLDLHSGGTLRGMVEAVRWLRWAPATLALVALGATASAFSFAYIPLLGAISRDVLHAGSAGLGTLTATSGIGMLASAVLANTVGIRLRRGRGVVITMGLGACAMAALGASSVLAASVALVICVAFLSSTRSSLAQFLMQSLSPPRMRGRVASLADFIGQTLTIAGSLGVGALAAMFGPTPVIVGCGVAILAIVALVVVAWPRILAIDVDHEARPVIVGQQYVDGQRRGTVPELPGTNSAAD